MTRPHPPIPSSDPPGEPIEPIVLPTPDPALRLPLKIEDWFSVLILGALAVITFANVLVRYLTDGSFAWTEEISIFLLIVLTMTAGASAFVRRQHIRIEIIADGGSPQRQRVLALISTVVVLLFFILLVVLSARMAYDDIIYGDTSPAIGVPNWWYSIWMPILSIAISLRVAGMLQRLLREPQ